MTFSEDFLKCNLLVICASESGVILNTDGGATEANSAVVSFIWHSLIECSLCVFA